MASLMQSHSASHSPLTRLNGGLPEKAVQALAFIVLSTLAATGVVVEVAHHWWRPLWADEVTTMQIVGAGSWSHLFEGVRAGLDATPPLYTAFGWALFQLGLSTAQVQSGLRALDSGLVILFLGLAYQLGRVFLDRVPAIMALGLFILAEKGVLIALALDLRTYMVYLFFATASLYSCVRLLRRPSVAARLANAACLAVLTFSHTIAITYAMCISGSLVLLHVLKKDYRAAGAQILCTVPAALIFLAWLPVVRAQAQLGSYIVKPGLYEFLKAFYVYPGSAVCLGALTVLVFCLSPEVRRDGPLHAARVSMSRCAGALTSGPDKAYCLMVMSSFLLATCAVWLFSYLVFPVFAARYFQPNVVLVSLGVTLLVWWSGMIYDKTAGGVLLFAIGVIALCLEALLWKPEAERKIPCYDGVRETFFEDADRGLLPVLTLYSQAWLSRVGRGSEVSLYPSETSLVSDDPEDAAHGFEVTYMRRFKEWSHADGLKSTGDLGAMKAGFVVLDDGKGGWMKQARTDTRFSFQLLRSKEILGRQCRLWKVTVAP